MEKIKPVSAKFPWRAGRGPKTCTLFIKPVFFIALPAGVLYILACLPGASLAPFTAAPRPAGGARRAGAAQICAWNARFCRGGAEPVIDTAFAPVLS